MACCVTRMGLQISFFFFFSSLEMEKQDFRGLRVEFYCFRFSRFIFLFFLNDKIEKGTFQLHFVAVGVHHCPGFSANNLFSFVTII
jgi:hypothetical protein